MCQYQRGTYECRGDGYLWDADSDGYDPDECDDPCPQCNTTEYLERAKEEAESTSYCSSNGMSSTGAGIWEGAVGNARAENALAAQAALEQMRVVEALIDDPTHPDGHRVKLFVYARRSAPRP